MTAMSQELERAVLAHLADREPGLVVAGPDDPAAAVSVPTDRAQLRDWAERLGDLAGRMCLALQGFFHPAAGRAVRRDVRALGEREPGVPDRVRAALAVLASLPCGVQHGGVVPDRLVIGPDGRPRAVRGVDQTHHTAAVADLAGSLAALLAASGLVDLHQVWGSAGAVLRGYQRHRPLQPGEVDVLGELVLGHLLLAGADRPAAALAQVSPALLRSRLRRLAGLGAPGLPGAGIHRDGHGDRLLARRRAVQGGSLSPLFYADPVQIVAGEGVWLVDASGRRYLDGYNNVAVVGHSHPNVVQAISRQAAVLHTHSRYLHANVVELAERLVASMPAGSGLDTCLFTTSGTEANELAWRLAVEYTSAVAGRAAGLPDGTAGAVVGSKAYHGSSRWLADLSSSEWPVGYRPAGVATFDGPVQDDAALTRAEASARVGVAVEDLRSAGRVPAMVIADSMFTSEGVRVVPAGFMTGLADGARAAGALYVADEVQVGFGRTGPQLWWFAALGVRPDVVTLGKPMGAGYPIAAVLTRREIADALAARYEFFSTFAGNPVGTAAALAVLDLLEDEAIPAAAVEVGELLRNRVRALAQRHPAVGDVRGHGLIAGIDLPSRQVANGVKEALKSRGVLVGTTGRRGDVLKVRPPLVWRTEHVEVFVAALEQALAAQSTS